MFFDWGFSWTSSKLLFESNETLCHHQKLRITKACLYNFDLRKPHFYIVKLEFTGVYIIFLISDQNIDCWYSLEPPGLEPPRPGGSNEDPQSMFEQKYEKYQFFLSENFQFWEVKFSLYLNRPVFVMDLKISV